MSKPNDHSSTFRPGPTSASGTPEQGSSPVYVRFCPSPMGTPHVGMIRTCLSSRAHVRHTDGTFAFRIGNTDAIRDSEESLDTIPDSLTWLDLDRDEGVGKGGPHKPYRQSQHMDLYKGVAAESLAVDYPHESFSTPEEIEVRHRECDEDPKLNYDDSDRNLTQGQKDAFRAEGRLPVLRIWMPGEGIIFTDLVCGPIISKIGSVSDYIVARVGGKPFYALINSIDGAVMGITYVLRGEDLLSSIPWQVVLYRVLMDIGRAQVIPEFGYLPCTVGESSRKLSKRDPQSNLLVHCYRGMILEGFLNHLILLGWPLSADHDVFSVAEMIGALSAHDVSPSLTRLDPKKREVINAEQVRTSGETNSRDRLVPYLTDAYPDSISEAAQVPLASAETFDELTARGQEILNVAAPLIQTRIKLLRESCGMLGSPFVLDDDLAVDDEALFKLRASAGDVSDAGANALEGLNPEQWDNDHLEEVFETTVVERRGMLDGKGVKPRLAYGPLHVAMTGRQVFPPLLELMEILGSSSTLTRLRAL